LDIENSTIHELKPLNPRAIRQGYRQANQYRQELMKINEFKGKDWKIIIDTY
jgi:hypothetical protein